MLEAKVMLTNATANSLLIVDELGRGTSTSDGYGLAYGLAQYIATELGAFAMFATHFHELSQLSQQLNNVKNLYVTCVAESNNIVMKYVVEHGISSQSFGVHVAEVAGFPETVITTARQKSIDLEQRMILAQMHNDIQIHGNIDEFVNDSFSEQQLQQLVDLLLNAPLPHEMESLEQYNEIVINALQLPTAI